MTLDPRLLEIVVCPRCHAHLQPVPDERAPADLVCSNQDCGLRFPVRDGIPVLLIDEAVPGQAHGIDSDPP